ncbi:hypothetical protein IAT38_000370 [Cryptococcus sp. DSM 104549]
MEDDAQPGKKQQKRSVPHVSNACDKCRKRKTRCDGGQPTCALCQERGWQCVYAEDDKRRTNKELEELKARVAHLECLESRILDLERLAAKANGAVTPSSPAAAAGAAGTITPSAPSQRPIRPLPRHRHNSIITHTGSDDNYDRLQRTEDGPLVQYGATSMWTHAPPPDRPAEQAGPSQPGVGAGRRHHENAQGLTGEGVWLDWSRNLPPELVMDKAEHDAALERFGAYYAPWCMTVNMPNFLKDLERCNTVDHSGEPAETRTPFYSPLLHCAVLFLGLYLLGGQWPEKMDRNHDGLTTHCTRLMGVECGVPLLSSLRAINLWSTCQNMKPSPAPRSNLGYTYYAMTYGIIQVLGININRGRMSEQELTQRNATYWTMFLQDVLRSITVGRPPIFATSNPPIPYPTIESDVDDVLLGVILAAVIDALYSPWSDDETRNDAPSLLGPQLQGWFASQPLQSPEQYPLPHILVMHMTYHLAVIFLYRPFYRSEMDDCVPSPAEKCNAAAKSVLGLLQLYDRVHGLGNGPMTIKNVIFSTSTIFLLKAVEDQCDGLDMASSLQDVEDMISLMGRLALKWRECTRVMNVLISLRAEWLPGVHHTKPSDSLTSSHLLGPPSAPPASGLTPALAPGSGPGYNEAGVHAYVGGAMGYPTGGGVDAGLANGQTQMQGFGSVPAIGGEGLAGLDPASTDLAGELHEWLMNQDFYHPEFTDLAGEGWGGWGLIRGAALACARCELVLHATFVYPPSSGWMY